MFAVVFPGQGSQYPGMGKDFFENFSVVREVFEEASDRLGIDMAKLCFEASDETLKLTENTQPAVLTVSYAIYSVVRDILKDASFFAGHSLGEYTACVALGVMNFSDAVFAVRKRGSFMQEAVPVGEGAMAAVLGLECEKIEDVCEKVSESVGVVEPANYNSPDQTVISGIRKAVEVAGGDLKSLGAKRIIMLNVSAPFHCSLMKPAAERLEEVLSNIEFSDPSGKLVSNVTSESVEGAEVQRELFIRQVYSPVKWWQSVLYMKDRGVDLFIEVGPSKVLSGLIRKTDRSVKVLNVEKVSDLDKLEGIL